MVGVTVFGLIFTPVFYVLLRKLSPKPRPHQEAPPPEAPGALAGEAQ
jgi:hypothetical protein